jgi:hypothetical protein
MGKKQTHAAEFLKSSETRLGSLIDVCNPLFENQNNKIVVARHCQPKASLRVKFVKLQNILHGLRSKTNKVTVSS